MRRPGFEPGSPRVCSIYQVATRDTNHCTTSALQREIRRLFKIYETASLKNNQSKLPYRPCKLRRDKESLHTLTASYNRPCKLVVRLARLHRACGSSILPRAILKRTPKKYSYANQLNIS